MQQVQGFTTAKVDAKEVGTTGHINKRVQLKCMLDPCLRVMGVSSTVNHLMEKIFAYDRSANFNSQVLHIDANISSPSSKWKKHFFTWPGDLNLIA